jgi:hypothetical protein
MIKLIFEDSKIKKISNSSIWRVAYESDTAPSLRNPYNKTMIKFSPKLSDWFKDNNIEYTLFWVDVNYTGISFYSKEDAMLFKLSWY